MMIPSKDVGSSSFMSTQQIALGLISPHSVPFLGKEGQSVNQFISSN
jgi:hypothetical protein